MTTRSKWLPVLLYAIGFFALSPHLPSHFSSGIWADGGDGTSNYWYFWWIRKAIVELHQSPFFTKLMQFPWGTSLRAQTMNPFNCYVGILLVPLFTLVQAHNLMVFFSFVAGGWTMFLLCLELTGAYWPSILGGAIFTFSNFHFMHAEGHLQLVTLEWLPLFVMFWRRFARVPTPRNGLLAAFALYLVWLSDFYYFFYSALFGTFYYLWVAREKKDWIYLFRRENLRGLLSFTIPMAMTTGYSAAALLLENYLDPFVGAHESRVYGMDLLSPITPGGHWYFARYTRGIWKHLSGNINESSVYVGWGVILLLAWGRKRRDEIRLPDAKFWLWIGVFFFVMSFGPTIHLHGREFLFPPMPYELMWRLFPPFRLSGTPVRMMVMVQMVVALFISACVPVLWRIGKRQRRLVLLALALTAIEYYPKPIPVTDMTPPPFATFLRQSPIPGALYDDTTPGSNVMLYQVGHERPISFGFMTRTATSLVIHAQEIRMLAHAGEYRELCKMGFGFLLVDPRLPPFYPSLGKLEMVWEDPERKLYRMCTPS